MASKRFLSILFSGLLLSSTAYAGSGTITYNMSYQSQFGGGGSGDGQMDYPEQVRLDSNGNLFVADAHNDRIQIFDQDGNYLNQFGTRGSLPGEFRSPYTIAFAPNNEIIIGEAGGGRMQILDSDYNFIREIISPPGFRSIAGAAFSPSGELYVTQYNDGEIQVFDSNYNYLRTVQSKGSADGELDGPAHLIFGQDGRYYVPEYYNNRISIFNADDTFARYMVTPDLFDGPDGLSIDQYGNIYVIEYNANRVQVFNKDGVHLITYGTGGTGDGEFSGAEAIYVAPDGTIYASDSGNNRVQILNFISTEVFASSPLGVNKTAVTPNAVAILNGSGTFNHSFIGYNWLDVDGTSWTLNGNSTFGGTVSVTNGDLFVNGNITTPNMSIATNGMLGGNGHIIGNLDNYGTVSPGTNDIGTLMVTGNYSDMSFSAYNIDVNAQGQGDKVIVNGNAAISGVLNINAANGNYAASTNYTILSATGNLTGNFASLNNNLAFLTATVSYDGHNAILNLVNPNFIPTQVDFIPYAPNGSELSVARSLNDYSAIGFNGDTVLADTVVGLNQQEAAAFLDQNTPEEMASMVNTQTQSLVMIQSPLWQRLSALPTIQSSSYGTLPSPSSDGQSFAMLAPASGGLTSRNVWLEAIGGVLNQNGNSSTAGYRSTVTGGRGGVDKAFSETLTLGISGAYLNSRTGFDRSANKAESNYGHVDLYGRKDYDGLLIEGFVGAGAGRIETTREIFAGGLNRTATGKSTAMDTNAALKLSHKVPMTTTVALVPSVTGAASWQRQNGFREKGAGALNMKMDEVTVTPVTLKPMLAIEKNFDNPKHGFNVATMVGAGATWQLNERQASVTAGFDQATTVPQFTVHGIKQKPFSANLVAGFTLQPTGDNKFIPGASITAASQFNSTNSNHTGMVRLSWNW